MRVVDVVVSCSLLLLASRDVSSFVRKTAMYYIIHSTTDAHESAKFKVSNNKY